MEFNKRNYKSISSPNKERRSEAFVTKKTDTTLNRDVFVLLKDLDLDPNLLSNHQSVRLHDSLAMIEKIRESQMNMAGTKYDQSMLEKEF